MSRQRKIIVPDREIGDVAGDVVDVMVLDKTIGVAEESMSKVAQSDTLAIVRQRRENKRKMSKNIRDSFNIIP